jgi:hypothetical protein
MGDVVEIRAYERRAAAADAARAGEKASLRFMASLMIFGPAATSKQTDVPSRRAAKRRPGFHR